MKVNELGKEIDRESKDIIAKAAELGIDVKRANSTIPEESLEKLKQAMVGASIDGQEKKTTPRRGKPMVSDEVASRGLRGKPMISDEVAARAPKGTPVASEEVEEKIAKDNKETTKKKEKTDVEVKEKEKSVSVAKDKEKSKDTEVKKAEVKAEESQDISEDKKTQVGQQNDKKEKKSTLDIRIVSTAKDREKEEEEKRQRKKEEAKKEKPVSRDFRRDAKPAGEGKRHFDKDNGSFKEKRNNHNDGRVERKSNTEGSRPTAPIQEAVPADKSGKKQSRDFRKRNEKDGENFSANKGSKNNFGGNKDSKYTRLSYDEGGLEKKTKGKKQQRSKEIIEQEIITEDMPVGTRVINVPITVAGFCEQMMVSSSQVILTLLKLGMVTNINASLDEDTVQLLAGELGLSVVIGKVEEEVIDEGLETFEDKEDQLKPRPPIITVMGHVDHGKTSLLDAIRKTNVTAQESGGITQHIGASEVDINGKKIVFLDTPGHEAFTAMRARGANITDIAVLVVAADDSVKPQTLESISHAKAAGVPIIVAINKMDKPGANPDMVKQDLSSNGVVVEEWGGDVIAVPVSAKKGDGIVNLLEMILLQAEVLELKANADRLAMGTVIEARLDKAKGPIATLLVTNGTLKAGQSIVAGTTSGKIRLMSNFKGDTIRKAGPATAVEILGLTEVPAAGDTFNSVKDDRLAKEIAEKRRGKQREEVLARNASTTLEELFSQIQEGEIKDLNLIVKGDVRGSVGAVVGSLEKLSTENVRVKIIYSGVGAVTESDVALAGTSGAIIIGFNVRPSVAVSTTADRENVQIKTYRVIYNIIDDVTNAIKGMLDPEYKEVVLGTVEIRDTFKLPGIGIIGGAYVTSGKVVRNAEVRLVRDGIVIHEGKISSLKRFKDDAKEVAQGYECGIGIENYNDIKEGDVIECFQMEEIARS